VEVDAKLIPLFMCCRNNRVTLGLGSTGTARVTLRLEPASAADARVESMTATNFPLNEKVTRGKFVVVMDSTRASAAESPSNSAVTGA